MSLKLEQLTATVLTNLEFGQLMNRHVSDLTTIAPAMLTDAPFNTYVQQITVKSSTYNKALLQVQKSSETDKIDQSDAIRDKATSAFSASLKLYAVSDDPAEVEASRVLTILFKTFKNLATLNYEAESMGIDKLVSDLESSKYADKVAFLNIGRYVTRMKTANQNFKTLFGNRLVVEASSETYDVKALRKEMLPLYNEFIDYVLSMAKAHNTPLFTTALSLINTARKYYADMVARGATAKVVKAPPTV